MPREDTAGHTPRRPFGHGRRLLAVRSTPDEPHAPASQAVRPSFVCALRRAGGFAMWGGLFSTFDCALLAIRQKDDPINPIMSGAITGGVLAARGGWRAAGKSAAIGGVILAVIEGVGILFTKLISDPSTTGAMLSDDMMKDQLQQQQQQALDQAKKNAEQDDTKSGWWSENGGAEGAAQPVGLASGSSS